MTTADLTEIEPMDSTYWDDYKDAAAPGAGSGNTLPPEGRYFLTFPQQINDSNFEIRKDAKTGKAYLSVTLGTKDDPMLIAEGDHQGYALRYFRFDSRFPAIFAKDGDSWKIVGEEKVHAIMDLIMNAGTGDRPVDAAGYQQAVERLAGITLPHPTYLIWGGYDKKASGKAKYLKSKDFPTVTNPDGSKTRASRLQRADPATGEFYTVFANLELGRRGFQPRG